MITVEEDAVARKSDISGLEEHVGYWLRFVSNHVSHAFMQKVEARGVTVAEWAVMREMLDAGPINPSQLAGRLGMTRGAISKLVERLFDKGLVARTHSDEDRRYQSVALTVQGENLVPVLSRLADENDQEFFGHLAKDEQARLLGLLKDVVQRHGWKDVPLS